MFTTSPKFLAPLNVSPLIPVFQALGLIFYSGPRLLGSGILSTMKTRRKTPDRKLIVLSVIFYLLLGLVEFALKAITVFRDFSGGDVTSPLAYKLGEGARLLRFNIVLYTLTLVLIHLLFAFLNGHYAVLAAVWLRRQRPWLAEHALGLAFLTVNGAFLTGVYALNTALYPASDLATVMSFLKPAGNAGALRIAATALLGLYLLGFAILNIRYARKTARIASLLAWAVLLVAPLDPVFLAQQALSRNDVAKNNGPNVIFIGLDSLNPRHTGYSGYPLPITPHLDSFLRENVVFENCYTPIARTFPAWYSILTGQYPVTSGVRFNLIKRKDIKSAEQCLGNILKKEGYSTFHFTDEVRFSNITSQEGFDRLRHAPMGIKDFVFGSFHDFSLTNVFFNNPLGYWLFPFLNMSRAVAHLYDGRYFINDLISSLDRLQTKKRFFLAAHLCAAHWPYVHASPRKFDRQPGADPNMQLYDSALSKVDGQLGRILSALRAKGLYDNSIIVVFSDHGESAEGHGTDLKDSEQNRVLLAWKPAGPPTHQDVPRLVRTIDIAPTVLDLLGEDPGRHPYDGVSLRPWIYGAEAAGTQDTGSVIMETEFSLDTPGGIARALQSLIEQGVRFYEFDRTGLITIRDDFHDVLIHRRSRAILTADWKLVCEVVVRGNTESTKMSLFDIRNDPQCKKDLSTERPDVFRDLWGRLRDYYGAELPIR